MKLTKLQRQANVLIVDNVEAYREASKGYKRAKAQAEFDLNSMMPTEQRPKSEFAMPERAKQAFKMDMDRASGALDALHKLFPTLPAWSETKWIH
jgi:hypothetical protein